MYRNHPSANKIAKTFGITGQRVKNILQRHGIKTLTLAESHDHNRTYSADDVKAWYAYYLEVKSTVKVGEHFGVGQPTVHNLFKKHNLTTFTHKESAQRRRYRLANPHVFRGELSREAEYWIGFLLADGCVHDDASRPKLSIALQQRDGHHLWKLKEFLGAEADPKEYPNRTMGTIGTHFTVSDEMLITDLETYGVTPRKSHTAEVDPRLSNSPDFWRGVIDGDGNISITTKGRPRIRVVGTNTVCGGFKDFCLGLVHTKANVRPHFNISTFELVGEGSLTVMKELYENSSTHLDRKYQTYKNIMKEFN